MSSPAGSVKVAITGDLDEFATNATSGLKSLARDLGTDLTRALARYSAGIGDEGTNAGEAYASAISDELRQASGQLGNLGHRAGQEYGQGVDSGVSSGLGNTEGTVRSALRSTAGVAGSSGGEAGGEFAGEFNDKVKEGFGELKGKLGDLVGGLGLASLVTTAIGGAWDRQVVAKGKLQAALGITPEEAAADAKTAASVYADNWGESLDDVTGSITALRQGLDHIGSQADLKGLAEQSLSFRDAFGYETQEQINAVSQMLRTKMAPNAQAAFDILTRGEQTGADKAGDLLDTFNEYSTQFRKLGLDGKESLGLIQQGLKGGARDSDLVADALKEFSLRSIALNDPNVLQGYKTLGLNARSMAEEIGKGGSSAKRGLQTVLDGLRDIQDPVKRAQVASELFGTQSEDTGKALLSLNLSTVGTARGMDNIAGAGKRLTAALNTTSSPLESLKRQALDTLSTLGEDALPILKPTLSVISTLGPELAYTATGLAAFWVAWKGYTIVRSVIAQMDVLRARLTGTATSAEASAAATAESQAAQSTAVAEASVSQARSLEQISLSLRGVQTQAAIAAAGFAESEASKAEAMALSTEAIARSAASQGAVTAEATEATAVSARGYATAMRSEAVAAQETAVAIQRANAQIVLSGRETAVATETSSTAIVAANERTTASGLAAGAGGVGGAAAGAGAAGAAGRTGFLGRFAGKGGLIGVAAGAGAYLGGSAIGDGRGGGRDAAKTVFQDAGAGAVIGGTVAGPYGAAAGAGAGAVYAGVKDLSTAWKDLHGEVEATGRVFNGSFKDLRGLAEYERLTAAGSRITHAFALSTREGGEASRQASEAVAKAAVQQSGLAKSAKAAGLTTKDLTNAVTGSGAAYDQVVETWRRSGKASESEIKALRRLREQYAEGVHDAQRFADLHGDVYGAEMKTSRSTDVLSGKVGDLHTVNVTGAQALSLVKDRTDAVTKSVDKNGRSLDDNTSFGQKNIAAIRQQAAASLVHAQAVYKQTGSLGAANDALAADRKRLIDNAAATGLNKDEVRKLADAIYKVPKHRDSKITADTAAAERALGALQARLLSLHDRTVRVNILQNGGTEQGAAKANDIYGSRIDVGSARAFGRGGGTIPPNTVFTVGEGPGADQTWEGGYTDSQGRTTILSNRDARAAGFKAPTAYAKGTPKTIFSRNPFAFGDGADGASDRASALMSSGTTTTDGQGNTITMDVVNLLTDIRAYVSSLPGLSAEFADRLDGVARDANLRGRNLPAGRGY